MNELVERRALRRRPCAVAWTGFVLGLALAWGLAGPADAQTNTPAPPAATSDTAASPKDTSQPKPTPAPPSSAGSATPAPASPSTATQPSATPPASATAPQTTPTPGTQSPQPTPVPTTPGATPPATPEGTPLAPSGKPQRNEIEPNGSPGIPDNATTENVEVPGRPIVLLKGQSTYDDAFKSIKASLDTVKKAMDKAGIKASGHPITIFSEPDDKGFKFQAAVPVSQKPDKTDFGDGVTAAVSPSGKAIKFQHRGAYDDIDSTYDVITAFLDAKGMQVDSPYIEEYLTDLTTSDDPNLQVDIYVFVK